MKHYLLMSASDVVARTMQAFAAPDGKEQGEWAGALLENAGPRIEDKPGQPLPGMERPRRSRIVHMHQQIRRMGKTGNRPAQGFVAGRRRKPYHLHFSTLITQVD